MTRYLVYDVFTDAPFGGNQLAVIPDATALPEHCLQSIAREFNYSETTFVYPPQDPAHTAKVRIFTPTMEVPFAGHPTIGTAHALRDLGHTDDMVLELGIGPIPCAFEGDDAAFTTSVPLDKAAEPDIGLIARALGLKAEQITARTHAPVQAGVGFHFVIVELTDRSALTQCAPVTEIFREGAETYPTGLDFAIYAYVRAGSDIDARMFAPLDDIPEDPATGSAAAALTALLQDCLAHPQRLSIRQGEDMGRLSIIGAETGGAPGSIKISGQAVQTMSGQLHV